MLKETSTKSMEVNKMEELKELEEAKNMILNQAFAMYLHTAADIGFDDITCVHISEDEYEQRHGKCTDVMDGFKPGGAVLWASISDDPAKEISQWDTFTRIEQFKMGEQVTTFKLAADAKIMYCTKLQDLKYIAKIIPGEDYAWVGYSIDWADIASICDVFILDTRFTDPEDMGCRTTIDMWDIPTTVIVFNHDTIYDVHSCSRNKYIVDNMIEVAY